MIARLWLLAVLLVAPYHALAQESPPRCRGAFVAGGVAGAFVGGLVGGKLEQAFHDGEDAGLGGAVAGVVLGFVFGSMLAARHCEGRCTDELRVLLRSRIHVPPGGGTVPALPGQRPIREEAFPRTGRLPNHSRSIR